MIKFNKLKKSVSFLLSCVMLLSVFTLTGTYAEEETGFAGVLPDGTSAQINGKHSYDRIFYYYSINTK